MKSTTKKSTKKVYRVSHSQGDVHKPLVKPPKLLVQPPKLTVRKILNLASKEQKERMKEIAVKDIRTVKLPKAHNQLPPTTLTYRVDTYSKHNKHIHRATIFCVDGDFHEDAKVIVDCSCSSFIFQAEYNLARRGSAFLWRSNGQIPMQNTKLMCCKHVNVALKVMLRRQQNGVLPKKSRIQKRISFMQG